MKNKAQQYIPGMYSSNRFSIKNNRVFYVAGMVIQSMLYLVAGIAAYRNNTMLAYCCLAIGTASVILIFLLAHSLVSTTPEKFDPPRKNAKRMLNRDFSKETIEIKNTKANRIKKPKTSLEIEYSNQESLIIKRIENYIEHNKITYSKSSKNNLNTIEKKKSKHLKTPLLDSIRNIDNQKINNIVNLDKKENNSLCLDILKDKEYYFLSN